MIAGIDFSTKAVDIVLLDEDTDAATWHRFELTGQDAFDRARSVHDAMPDRSNSFWDEVVACGLEQPRGNHGVVHMARIQGAVIASLPRRLLVQPLNPAEWRKTVGLPGNASKGHVAIFAHAQRTPCWQDDDGRWRYHEPELWSQDACDAYCIALATRTLLQRTEAA